jgi:hypothetical protein
MTAKSDNSKHQCSDKSACRPKDSRQADRQRLADLIGYLLAKHWLNKQRQHRDRELDLRND